LLQLIPGIVLLFNQASFPDTAGLAWITIIVGIITVIIGASLLGGSKVARVLVTLSLMLSIASAIVAVILTPHQAWSAISSGLVALIGLILLWTGRASDWFNSQRD
jgi:hypothetical protein